MDSEGNSQHLKSLTMEDAENIRRAYTGKRGEMNRMAKEYQVSYGVIWHLLNNNTYRPFVASMHQSN